MLMKSRCAEQHGQTESGEMERGMDTAKELKMQIVLWR